MVPLAEMFGYVTSLRTITSGRATSSMVYDHHEQLSASIMVSGAVGLAVAVLLALKNRSLVTVAVAGCVCVFLTEQLLHLL